MLIQMVQLVCLYLACRVRYQTHIIIMTNTHTTDAIPSIHLWADTKPVLLTTVRYTVNVICAGILSFSSLS